VWAASAAVGLALGPIGGGLLLEHFWWGSVLLVNVPLVALALLAGWWVLPTSRDPSSPSLDLLGAALSTLGFGVLVWAIIEGPVQGWASGEVVAGFVVAGLLLGGFVTWELRCPHPMLDVRLFRLPRFSMASVAITLSFLTLNGMVFLLTQYLQSVRGYTPLRAGVLVLGFAVGMLIMSPVAARLVERVGTKLVVAGGMGVVAMSMLLVLALGSSTGAWLPALVALLVALGFGTVMAPATESIMGALPRAKAGVGSAVNDTTRQLGAAVGVAVFGSVHASRYRVVVEDRLTGLVPTDVVDEVSHNVQHGIAAGSHAPAPLGPRIVDTASDAFISGFHVAVVVGAAICLVGAAVVLRYLPARQVTGEDP
jgi:EmrB/QacA subfamily drug resistance transporter